MFTINTQLAYFKYNLDSKKLIVNIKWFKVDNFNNRQIEASSFSQTELTQLLEFIKQNRLNFPGECFVEEAKNGNLEVIKNDKLSVTFLPLYLIVSKDPNLNLGQNNIYEVMIATLMDENYQSSVAYTLNFDIIGKIEIYKEVKKF
jgi:hypothetical protein